MGLDLAQRYDRIAGATDHVCTGNTAYSRSAIAAAGFFDESMGYGYDNDISYRLSAAGYRLVILPAARSLHHWRATAAGYLAQQYGFGYGRLDVVARHPRRVAGDSVSPAGMMAHPIVLGIAIVLRRGGGGSRRLRPALDADGVSSGRTRGRPRGRADLGRHPRGAATRRSGRASVPGRSPGPRRGVDGRGRGVARAAGHRYPEPARAQHDAARDRPQLTSGPNLPAR